MATELWAVGLTIAAGWCGAGGAVLLKKGSNQLKLSVKDLIKNWPLIAGIALYALSVFFFVPALKGGELSVLFPLIALSYIWVALLSVKFLGEKMTKAKWTGIALVILGIILIGLGS